MTPIRILVVDDREENLIAMQAALKDGGFEIVEANSGPAALERAAEMEFAAILLDVQMPGMDGFETARRLRQLAHAKRTPIVFVTAIHRTEGYEELGYVAGAVDFLFKPINPTILLAKVSVFADLYRKTEEVRRQSELLHAAALKEQENALLRQTLAQRDEFLSIASHELKTPITPLNLQVQAFIQMVKDETLHLAPRERILRMLQTSQTQIDRLARLVDELIDISRLKLGKLQLNRQPADAARLVHRVLDLFGEELRKNGCDVKFYCADQAQGYWDPFRIEQVIINLVQNAMKYGSGKPVEITLRCHEGRAVLTVMDQGIGIAKEDQSRIFQRFERAVSAKNYGGLGLGLYISQQIVEMHGGRIRVDSRIGEGSTFTVELPLLATESILLNQ